MSPGLTVVLLLHDGHQAVEPAGDEGEPGVEHHDVRPVLVHHPHTLAAVEALQSGAHMVQVSVMP